MYNWVTQFIGIEYKDKASGFSGSDCWGLYRLIKKIHEDIVLPSREYKSAEDIESVANAIDKERLSGSWMPLKYPENGCFILLKIAGYPIHCGYCLNAKTGEMLHSLKGHNSAKDNFKSSKWKDRIEGFYSYVL